MCPNGSQGVVSNETGGEACAGLNKKRLLTFYRTSLAGFPIRRTDMLPVIKMKKICPEGRRRAGNMTIVP
jgi:hypothetical protein